MTFDILSPEEEIKTLYLIVARLENEIDELQDNIIKLSGAIIETLKNHDDVNIAILTATLKQAGEAKKAAEKMKASQRYFELYIQDKLNKPIKKPKFTEEIEL